MSETRRTLSVVFAEHRPVRELIEAVSALRLASKPSPEDWLSIVSLVSPLVAGQLDWLEKSDQAWFRAVISDFVKAALTEHWVGDHNSFRIDSDQFKQALETFNKWLVAQPDDHIVSFCWDLVEAHPTYSRAREILYNVRSSGRRVRS